jgi:protein-disulfide isomerase
MSKSRSTPCRDDAPGRVLQGKFEAACATKSSTTRQRREARGEETFRITSTPTFFINGQRHAGSMSIDEIEKIIKPMIGA